jgi:hypothetical protein
MLCCNLKSNITTGLIFASADISVEVTNLLARVQSGFPNCCHPLLVPLILAEQKTQALHSSVSELGNAIRGPNSSKGIPWDEILNTSRMEELLLFVEDNYRDAQLATKFLRDHGKQLELHSEGFESNNKYHIAIRNFGNRLAIMSSILNQIEPASSLAQSFRSFQRTVSIPWP